MDWLSPTKIIRGDSVLETDGREFGLCDAITWDSGKETVLGRGRCLPKLPGCIWPCIIWLESRLASVRGEEAAIYAMMVV